MAESSFPIKKQNLDIDQWAKVTKGVGDGILDEYGFPYKLTGFDNVTNTAVLKPSSETGEANAILNGFYHSLDADFTVSLPPVATRTPYYIVLRFDPLSLNNTTNGPVSTQVLKSLPKTDGKKYLHLWTVTRNPNELLTNADVRMIRPRIAPTLTFASEDDMMMASKTLWGTIANVHGGRSSNKSRRFMAMSGDAENGTDAYWKPLDDWDWTERADTGTYKSGTANYFRRALGRKGLERRLRGVVSFADGRRFRAGGEYAIFSGNVSADDAPSSNLTFITSISEPDKGNPGFATVRIDSAGGVTAWPSRNCNYISLDGCTWEAKA